MIRGILLPVLGLIALAALMPRLFQRVTPETTAGLVMNFALSAAMLTLASAGYFFWAYLRNDQRLLELVGIAPGYALAHFLKLGLGAGLIWGPVLLLAVSYVPRRWKENTW